MLKIPFSPPDIGEEEIEAVAESMRQGWITTGPKTKAFEKALSQRVKTEKTVCLQSATAALELALHLYGIGPGDEVITSAYTYSASASVIAHTGATIRMVDVAPGSFFMDMDRLEATINERTKAIIPVDYAGVPADYDRIFEIVREKSDLFQPKNKRQQRLGRILVLADAAHALGAIYKGKPVGSVADMTAFSFHAVKNLTTAEGGALTWTVDEGEEDYYQELQLMSLHGQSKDALAKLTPGAWEYDIVAPNYKCNMTDIQAAMGLVQLSRYDKLLERRRELIEAYHQGLQGLGETLCHRSSDYVGSGHLYPIRLHGLKEKERNEVIQKMAQAGVATNVHYKPLPMMTAYRNLGFSIEDYPMSFAQYENLITLPLHTKLRDEELDYVIMTLRKVLV